jgi:hypothetical protein
MTEQPENIPTNILHAVIEQSRQALARRSKTGLANSPVKAVEVTE